MPISQATTRTITATLLAISFIGIARADPTWVTDSSHHTAALINMDDVSMPGCETIMEPITVTGVQFGRLGGTLEQFQFTDRAGTQWSVPTHIDGLSKVDRSWANSFIKAGNHYLLHMIVCGSGGFPSLVALYGSAPGQAR